MNSEGRRSITPQSDLGFLSPNIMRRHISKEAVAAHSVRTSRRAKSSEPSSPHSEGKLPMTNVSDKGRDHLEHDFIEVDCSKHLSSRVQESMSKTELVNCYRLLMGEKLRLERFLSIMSKNNEMARNRLESDLLDAMMCIEDLKQALELRMARRRKIDPREAEERRYLIRQNKKLLNQLYDAAKKIERLELTKVEMKEQLELLDFQILEVENQKTIMEEELRKLPLRENNGTQTDDDTNSDVQLIAQLRKQLSTTVSELHGANAEAAAAMAKQQHLENLVRELRRDNVDLRDQVSKLEDTENSLAESDKPSFVVSQNSQVQLESYLERIRDLELKLHASRNYTGRLESRLQHLENMSHSQDSSERPVEDNASIQDRMRHEMESVQRCTSSTTHGADLLLRETIKTFHALIAERDQELAQMRHYIRINLEKQQPDENTEFVLPQLYESAVQTDCCEPSIPSSRYEELAEEIRKMFVSFSALRSVEPYIQHCFKMNGKACDLDVLICDVKQVRENIESDESQQRSRMDPFKMNEDQAKELNPNESVDVEFTPTREERPSTMRSSDARFLEHSKEVSWKSEKTSSGNLSASAPPAESNQSQIPSARNPTYYSLQLQNLKEQSELELAGAQVTVLQRRCQDLENRVRELNEEVDRVRSDAKSTEASLSAARRTEAALRRRLLIAMDMPTPGTGSSANRFSVGANLSHKVETRSALELEAALIKSEATNSSLMENAQLERSRFHDQSSQINQLEAERRALLDRISILQTAEANAQRGIVRLQALYQDMLREYSESRSQDLTWHNRQLSQSSYRTKKIRQTESHKPGPPSTSPKKTESTVEMGTELNIDESNTERQKDFSDASKPVGRCSIPTCVEVRHLLKEFQCRFGEVVLQLKNTQRCLDAFQTAPTVEFNGSSDDHYGLTLIKSVREQIGAFVSVIGDPGAPDCNVDVLHKLISCSDSLEYLELWLRAFIRDNIGDRTQPSRNVLTSQVIDSSDKQVIKSSINGLEEYHQTLLED